MLRTRVKICGITRKEDAIYAASLGADSIGMVFHRSSPRAVDIPTAQSIRQIIPPFVTLTALFLDESADWVARVIDQVDPNCLQFHGTETDAFCASWSIPFIKTIPMGNVSDPREFIAAYPSAQGFLLDSNVTGRQGGSGDTFDWSRVPDTIDCPLILAGGLDSSNVAAAIYQVKPWGVDVSSGVEKSKGVKSPDLLSLFFSEVNRGDADAYQR